MVKEYLQKTKEEFVEQHISLKNREMSLQIRIIETNKMMQLLEETNDPNYALFTPREVNPYNKKKIGELQIQLKELESEILQTREDIILVESKIREINDVICAMQHEVNESTNEKDSKRFLILEVQEKERQRIARDLHDSTVQNLTSLVHKTELCMKLMDSDTIRCKLELSSLNKTLRDIIDETRNMIYDLRPMSFDDIGFDVTIERYLDKIKSETTTQFHYNVIGEAYPLNSVIELTLLRVIQEGCNNAVKHGRASKVDICMEYKKGELLLSIVDDGDGYDLSLISEISRSDNSGFGISMMKERIFLLSGKIDIQSSPSKGFSIYISVPV